MKIPHVSQYRILALEPRALDILTKSIQTPAGLRNHMATQIEKDGITITIPEPLPQVWDAGGGVKVMDVCGELAKYGSSLSDTPSLIDFRLTLRRLASDPNVGGIILRFDTPGGTVAGTDDFAQEIARVSREMPCWGFCEDLCASAGYWCASQTSRISCTAPTEVGCIGTYMYIQDLSAMADMMGVKVIVVKAGKFKGAGTPGKEVTSEEVAMFQELVDALNYQFLTAVARGRGLSPVAVQELADGRCYVGEAAMALGLVDAVEPLEATVQKMQALINKKTGGVLRNGNPIPPARGAEAFWGEMFMGRASHRALGAASRTQAPRQDANQVDGRTVSDLPAAAPALAALAPAAPKPTAADYRKAFAIRPRGLYPLDATAQDLARYEELGLTPEQAVQLKHDEPATAEEMRLAFDGCRDVSATDAEILEFVSRRMSAPAALSAKRTAATNAAWASRSRKL